MAQTRLDLEATEATVDKLRSARIAAEGAERQSAHASALAAELSALNQARASRDAAAQRLDAAIRERRSADELAELERSLNEARTKLQTDAESLAALRARSGAIAAAVAAIAAHLSEHDRNCPVCKTEFPEGMLRRIVDGATSQDDAGLRAAQKDADQGRDNIRNLEGALATARTAEEALRVANDEAERTASAVPTATGGACDKTERGRGRGPCAYCQ